MISNFRKYFIPNPAYFTYWYPTTGYSKQKHQHREVTDAEIELHLAGKQGLGVSPFVDEENVKFGVIDVDVKDFSIVDLLIKRLVKLNIYPNVFQSKSKGFHIWIFPEKPISAKKIRDNLSKVITDDIAIEKTTDKNDNPLEKLIVELFPKQDKVTEKGGSKVNLPLFADQRKQLDFKGEIKDFGVFITPLKNFEDPQAKKSAEVKTLPSKKIKISETYPCIERVLQGVSEGERDEWGLELVRYMAYLKNPTGVIDATMHSWNAKNSPPLEDQEIEKLIRQGGKYAGKNAPDCNKPFVKMFCDREHCRKAELILCENPLLIKKIDGYYMKNSKGNVYGATNFTMEVISADEGIKTVTVKVIQSQNEGYIIIGNENPKWGVFVMSCGFQKIVCDYIKGTKLSFLLSAELANTNIKIEKTSIVEMDYEKIIAVIKEDIMRGRIPEYEKDVELYPQEISSGWYQDGVVYLRAGDFCQRHHFKTRELANILKSSGVKQKSVRPPITNHDAIKTWEIILEPKNEFL